MRFNEIESPINRHHIKLTLQKYFNLANPLAISIDNDGRISLGAGCTIIGECSSLPVKFKVVKGGFNLYKGGLTTLEGCPIKVEDGFSCSRNNLTSLVGGPTEVTSYYDCSENQLTSFVGAPSIIKSNFIACYNPITSFDGLPKEIDGYVSFSWSPNLPLLPLCFAKISGGVSVYIDKYERGEEEEKQLEDILIKYLGKGRKAAIQCAAELSRTGFKGNARL